MGLPAGEIAVDFAFGYVGKGIRPAVGVEELEGLEDFAVLVDQGQEVLFWFHSIGLDGGLGRIGYVLASHQIAVFGI